MVTTTLLYALASVALAARIFGAEAVLSSESSGWSDLFRRPALPRAVAEPATALLTLALLFPAYFLASAGLSGLPAPLDVRLAVAIAVQIVLFAGAPLLAVWLTRIEVRSGLGLQRPPLLALFVAVLFGVAAWPLVHEMSVLLRQLGFTTLRAEHLKRIEEAIAGWRELSPAFVAVALAVVPAVVEELFFRGFLLRALLSNGRPVRAVAATAAPVRVVSSARRRGDGR